MYIAFEFVVHIDDVIKVIFLGLAQNIYLFWLF